ncbi:hypothetical protein IW261DRAFT_1422610 [Armillaria novae-zelandiae]|uniref:Uncharacterized protein n=1 Tax=Armillaria novae-zelandiae TaxID=153914 RepID=A0AA39UDJ7_9AGAR|nr:hypothetical protein IW261DRAFT_1422610 [Armillaria novae-zelandiae]
MSGVFREPFISYELHRVMHAATAQQHVNRLYEPHNLFAICSILATHSVETHWQIRTEIRNDITALALLRQEGYELEAKEIQTERDNIRYAIKELDALLDEAEHGSISAALV